MKKVSLEMSFKGARDYLQGGDLYNAIIAELAKVYDLDKVKTLKLSFHRFVRKNCDLFIPEQGEDISPGQDNAADISLAMADGWFSAYLVETDREVVSRTPFKEDEITDLCAVDGQTITISGQIDYSPIEIIVAMTKKLHYALVPTNRKWIFSKLECSALPSRQGAGKLSVKMKHNFNNRLTKSEIYEGDAMIGFIYFSLI
jgi:hypothetical protein